MKTRVARGLIACTLLAALSTACGSGDGGGLPSLSTSFSPTRVLPSVTVSPDRSEAAADAGEETGGGVVPTVGPSERPDQTTPGVRTPSVSTAPSPTTYPTATEGDTASDTGGDDASGDAWVWILLAALVIGAALLAWLLDRRTRRRRAWNDGFTAAQARVAWVGRDLIPSLQASGSLDRAAGGWLVSQPQVTQIEAELMVLRSSARTGTEVTRARALGDALRSARTTVEVVLAGGAASSWTLDLDGARAVLESALVSTAETG